MGEEEKTSGNGHDGVASDLEVSGTVRARSIELVDAAGTAAARLSAEGGGVRLALGAAGGPSITLEVAKQGVVHVSLTDAAGRARARVAVAGNGMPVVSLSTADGKAGVLISLGDAPTLTLASGDGSHVVLRAEPAEAVLALTTKQGSRIGIAARGNANSGLVIGDPAGVRLSFGMTEGSAGMAVHDSAARRRAAVAVSAAGEVRHRLYAEDGSVIWTAPPEPVP